MGNLPQEILGILANGTQVGTLKELAGTPRSYRHGQSYALNAANNYRPPLARVYYSPPQRNYYGTTYHETLAVDKWDDWLGPLLPQSWHEGRWRGSYDTSALTPEQIEKLEKYDMAVTLGLIEE